MKRIYMLKDIFGRIQGHYIHRSDAVEDMKAYDCIPMPCSPHTLLIYELRQKPVTKSKKRKSKVPRE